MRKPVLLPRTDADYVGKTCQLTPDQLEHFRKELQADMFGSKALLEHFSGEGKVDLGMAYSVLAMREARLADLCKLLGIELDSATDRERRYTALRQANERIRELELQMGQAVGAEQGSAFLQAVGRKLDLWWDEHGFGHITEMNFNKSGGLVATFSCHLFLGTRYLLRDKPVSERMAEADWHESLRQRGFLLRLTEGDRDPDVLDCDQNRQLLQNLFSEHFPGSRFTGATSHYGRDGQAELRDITVYFHDLGALAALPLPPTPKKDG